MLSILDFIFIFIQSGNVYPKILGYFLKNFPFPPFALFFKETPVVRSNFLFPLIF